MDRVDLFKELVFLRKCLERGFSPETAIPGTKSDVPSAGHCAAVAVILHDLLGGDFVSAKVEGQSHWFNRIPIEENNRPSWVDVDLTADQFGLYPCRMYYPNQSMYPGTRIRGITEVNLETLERARLLKENSRI